MTLSILLLLGEKMSKKILVLGATGLQGFVAAQELVKQGFSVRGLTSSGNNPKAEQLVKIGVEMVKGDLFDEESLYQAMCGMGGVLFIPVIPSITLIHEIQIGYNVIQAAERAGVQYLLHISVARAGHHAEYTTWGKGMDSSMRSYWLAKATVNEWIKASTIPHWSIFKPAYMMDVFLPPKVVGMHPLLSKGEIISATKTDSKIDMMNVADQAKLIAQAFNDFTAFDHQEIDLAGDSVSLGEVAQILSEVTGKKVKAVYQTGDELFANENYTNTLRQVYPQFDPAMIVKANLDSQTWFNTDGYQVDIAKANTYGVKLSSFSEWAKQHKDEFIIG